MTQSNLIVCVVALLAGGSLQAAELTGPLVKLPRIAPASAEAELAIKGFQVPPGFQIDLFAAEPMLAHPVAFAVDERNRLYVAESFRVGEQVTDIRRHMNWLDEELASTNTVRFRRLIEKYLDPALMAAESERISLLEDTDKDGRADRATVFAEGFNDITSGIAAGVLARKSDVWFACIPDLWRLRDLDGDGKSNLRQSLAHGFGVRFGFYGHDLHGLRFGPDGKLYFSIGDRGFNVVSREGKRLASPETGAVLRCNPDGSDLEIFATGLRNPQELAFDQYGNLFTGDNNSDGGDQARWTYLVEGGDSGWRIGWQFLTWPVLRGPWNAEKMWRPPNEEQPAYIVPPLANFSNGPSGVTFNPGPGLPVEYANQFFMCDFKGTAASSLIYSFGLKPKGAGFEVTDLKPFVSRIVATDVDFGFDGSIYISDWVEGWGKTGKGRIYRVWHPAFASSAELEMTRRFMARGFESLELRELISLLSWPDQRVRQEAQFELAARGRRSVSALAEVARAGTNRLARLHSIWAIGQIHAPIARRDPEFAGRVVRPLMPLLEDSDSEVRAQTAKVLGEARYARARSSLARLVVDARFPRVQFFSAMALGKIGGRQTAASIIEMLRQNADRDAFLRHAGVMALNGIDDRAALERAAQDRSEAVRLAALLVYRRQHDERAAAFLFDSEPRLVLEAARAIYDLPIENALPKLASLVERPTLPEPLLRRVINANARVGGSKGAQALARLAASGSAPESGRAEALLVLEEWARPSGRDRVTGLWRPIAPRDGKPAVDAFQSVMAPLLADAPDSVRAIGARLAGKFGLTEAGPALAKIAQSAGASAETRVECLRALAGLRHPELREILSANTADSDVRVRTEALTLLTKSDPAGGTRRLGAVLESDSVPDKQFALRTLGQVEHPAAIRLLSEWLDRFRAGTVDPRLQLELLEAASAREELRDKVTAVEQSLASEPLGRYAVAREGGNALVGQQIFFQRAEVSCSRCHKAGGAGGEAGPPLDATLGGRTREYLLESIVAPNKTIAPGFENVVVTLKDGATYAGVVRSETEESLVIYSPEEAGLLTFQKDQIGARQRSASGMPEGMGEVLSRGELRDLVEFLATLAERSGP